MRSLEQAKTALRTMGKYVPVDLVRLLYHDNREPALGGELTEVSMMFSDIEGFTSLAERVPPDVFARALGRYFEVTTAAVHEHAGVIDKYIGDSLMALWNVPRPCPAHATHACRAALACAAAAEALQGTPAWEGLPPLRTRFGLHKAEVVVGHFGAPNRMSYTCIGDGVNLASRLEGLNKQYGTTIVASQIVRDEAAGEFRFRLLDVVAVQGKTGGVTIYELRGPASQPDPAAEVVRRYEQAFALYRDRDFAAAVDLLHGQPDDPPSRVLMGRCREFIEDCPAEWDGVYVARSK